MFQSPCKRAFSLGIEMAQSGKKHFLMSFSQALHHAELLFSRTKILFRGRESPLWYNRTISGPQVIKFLMSWLFVVA